MNVFQLLAERNDVEVPEGWVVGGKVTDWRGCSRNDFRWPGVGGEVQAWDDGEHSKGECPTREGDGLTIALCFNAMSSGGQAVRDGFRLVATPEADVVHRDGDFKLRTRGVVRVLAEISLRHADLWGADLESANLYGANLTGANLTDANLVGANLTGANLGDANLKNANLADAYLRGANLRYADLRGANLWGANLWGADLWGADLTGSITTNATLPTEKVWLD